MSNSCATPDDGQRTPADVAGITQDGIEGWPSIDDLGTWFYVAGPVGPERSPTGAPTLSLLEFGKTAILQCGARWEAEPAALERIRQEAARRAGLPQLRLSPAPAEVKSAWLELVGADGSKTVLQETGVSNFPPYAAIFHVPLDAERRARVKEAVGGKAGVLSIEYAVRIQRRARAIARVAGTLDAATLSSISPDDGLGLVNGAIAAGQLSLTERVEGPAPDKLRASAREGALGRAAAMTGSSLSGGAVLDSLAIDATVSLAAVVTDETTRGTDIATWWQGGRKPSLLGGAGAAPEPTAAQRGPSADEMPVAGLLSVERGLKGAPVAFVEARAGASTAVLRGPDFAAASLAAPVGSPVRIVAHYTDGGPVYESEIAWPGGAGRALDAAELGLARITLDASSRKAAGARSLAAKVTYSPSGEGTVDLHEARFRYGEWTDEWLVVTRNKSLGGSLAVEWRDTGPEGAETVHPRESREGPNIAL